MALFKSKADKKSDKTAETANAVNKERELFNMHNELKKNELQKAAEDYKDTVAKIKSKHSM